MTAVSMLLALSLIALQAENVYENIKINIISNPFYLHNVMHF